MTERTVALPDMLEAREQRYWMQQELLSRWHKPLLCFTMNIAGPVKNSDDILRTFRTGQQLLRHQLSIGGIKVLFQAEKIEFTGNEAFYVLDAAPVAIKRLTAEIEDSTPIGRLFDMDVLEESGRQVSRRELGLSERKCLICGGPAKACSSRRIHSVAELQEKTASIIRETFRREDCDRAAELAVRSLLYEVAATPKPGLVDRNNSGSHKDMDIFTFLASSAALFPYFRECASIGMDTAHLSAEETMKRLRWAGKQAELAMERATGGVNTHKGAVFSIGILCGGLGRLERRLWQEERRVLSECAAMTKGLTAQDFANVTEENARTVGQKLYLRCGITGVRGQAEAGFPAVLNVGLPALRKSLEAGCSLNEAGCHALLAILTETDDTNLIARSDRETQLRVTQEVRELLDRWDGRPGMEELSRLDDDFIRQNLSPGGSADLLAMTYFLYFLTTERKDTTWLTPSQK